MPSDSLFTASWMPEWATTPTMQFGLSISMVVIIALVIHLIIRPIVLRVISYASRKSPIQWDDIVYEQKVWHRLLNLVPLIIFRIGLEWVPALYPDFQGFLMRMTVACMILVVALTIDATLTAANEIYRRKPLADRRPLKSYIQLIKLFVYIIAGILIVARLADQSPWYFIGGLGAMTAVLLLIFQGTILSLVASIQLTNNNLLQIGDWIEMPQFNADGDVVDIALNTVKVRNWDQTITVIPAHKFLDHSFKNWRGMSESGGRQIKRAISIDTSTMRFLTDEEIHKFSNFVLLKDYIDQKLNELEEYNAPYADNPELIVNSRRLTNLGTFRAYVFNYLKTHPYIHQRMTLLVRQLHPTPEGLPLEIYAYTNDTRWPVYEGVQADIFDHILSIAREFGLRVYQRPSGYDLISSAVKIADD